MVWPFRTNCVAGISSSGSATKAVPGGRPSKCMKAMKLLPTAKMTKTSDMPRIVLSSQSKTKTVSHLTTGVRHLQRLQFVLISLLLIVVFSLTGTQHFQVSLFLHSSICHPFVATKSSQHPSTSVFPVGSIDIGKTSALSKPAPVQPVNSNNDKYSSDCKVNLQENSFNLNYFLLLEQIKFFESSEEV